MNSGKGLFCCLSFYHIVGDQQGYKNTGHKACISLYLVQPSLILVLAFL